MSKKMCYIFASSSVMDEEKRSKEYKVKDHYGQVYEVINGTVRNLSGGKKLNKKERRRIRTETKSVADRICSSNMDQVSALARMAGAPVIREPTVTVTAE